MAPFVVDAISYAASVFSLLSIRTTFQREHAVEPRMWSGREGAWHRHGHGNGLARTSKKIALRSKHAAIRP